MLTRTRNAWEGLGILGRFIRIIYKIVILLSAPFIWIAVKYKHLWDRFVYKNGKLSKPRAAFFSWVTILVLSMFTETWLGEAVKYATIEPISDAFLMALTYKTETFYLNTTEEIDPIHSTHSVQGCLYAETCNENDSLYFIVKHRMSHDIWKLFKYGNPIYVPGHVVAPIVPGVNECKVTYYGYQMTTSYIARLLRSLQVYPIMLEADCKYLGLENPHG